MNVSFDQSAAENDAEEDVWNVSHILQPDHEDEESEEQYPQLPGEEESRLFSDLGQDEYTEPLMTMPLLNIDERYVDTDADDRLDDIDSSQLDQESSGVPFWHNFFGSTRSHDDQASMDVAISSIFLKDYENSRPCSLPSQIDVITPFQVRIHNIRYSYSWQCILFAGIASLFISSCFDGRTGWGTRDNRDQMQLLLTLLSAVIFTLDVIMRTIHDYHDGIDDERPASDGVVDLSRAAQHAQARKTRARRWKTPLLLMIFAVTVETYVKVMEEGKDYVWSGCLKPLVFFYASTKARDGAYRNCAAFFAIEMHPI